MDYLTVGMIAGLDVGGVRAPLYAQGPALTPISIQSPPLYDMHFGGGIDVSYQFDLHKQMGLFFSAGAEYYLNYSTASANISTIYGRPGLGVVFHMTDSSDLLAGMIGRLGYQWTNGVVFHPDADETRLSNFDAALGGKLDWRLYGERWFFGFGIEGFWTFTRARIDTPPPEFNLMLSWGYRLPL